MGYPDQRFLDHGDTFDAFMQELDLDRERKPDGFFRSAVVPKKKEEVGKVYPLMLELDDIHSHVLTGDAGFPQSLAASLENHEKVLRSPTPRHPSGALAFELGRPYALQHT